MHTKRVLAFAAAMLLLAVPAIHQAQRGGGRGGGPAGRQGAAIDLTGYWVAVVSEDWEFRMVAPDKGIFDTLPLNAEGRRVGNTWDPAKDEAAGEECRAYGAGNIMRMPTRLHITWENDTTLRIDTDAGTQTRMLHFGPAPATMGEPSWQGYSVANWEMAPGGGRGGGARGAGGAAAAPVVPGAGGDLKVITTNLKAGYVRRNGAPYSKNAVITEYYDLHGLPNGDQWFTVTTKVDDPTYFNNPYLTTSDFKKLPDAAGWSPSPCSAK
jgi:hypothetical protein